MRALVAIMLGALGVVLIIAGVDGSAENLFTSLLGTAPKTPKSNAGGAQNASGLPGAHGGLGGVIGNAIGGQPTAPATPLPGGGVQLPNGGTLV